MREADTHVTSEDDKGSHAGTSEWVGELLGEWQAPELRIARGFAECRGLAVEQLEDIYQETALALLARPYGSEEHLRNALRHGIKHRALNVHRDTRRRAQILQQSAPSMQRLAEGRESQAGPEDAALQEQDRLIVREFLAELEPLEQQVFWLTADGMRYRAIAPVLGVPVNVARNASRSCERKRERFQLLYDTGRLCGYREATIRSLQAGELTGDELARRAFAHLDACAQCRAAHRTNARRLGRSFQRQLAGLLPLPGLLEGIRWVRHPRLQTGAHVAGGVRERAAVLIGLGGAGKVTAGVATVAVIAGGTIGATGGGQHHRTPAKRNLAPPPAALTTEASVARPVQHREKAVRVDPRHPPRPPTSVHAAATVAPPAAGSQGPAPEAAVREFGPEWQPGAPTAFRQATGHSAGSKTNAAEREFGTPVHADG